MTALSMAEREAQALFDDGWGVTSRKYRMISRCPPDLDLAALVKARTLPPLKNDADLRDFYRRVVGKETRIVSRAVMDALNMLHGRGMKAAIARIERSA